LHKIEFYKKYFISFGAFSPLLLPLAAFWRFSPSFLYCFYCAFAMLKYRYLLGQPRGKNEAKTLIFRYKNRKNYSYKKIFLPLFSLKINYLTKKINRKLKPAKRGKEKKGGDFCGVAAIEKEKSLQSSDFRSNEICYFVATQKEKSSYFVAISRATIIYCITRKVKISYKQTKNSHNKIKIQL
jgi:hypothetical protein